MPKNQNTETKKKSTEVVAKPPTPVPSPSIVYTLGPENAIKGEKKTDKIFFSDIRQNGKTGIFTNIVSRTPEDRPTLLTFGQNKYINIELNDMFKQFLYGIYDRIDPEFIDLINDAYQIEGVFQTYQTQGFVKCKVDLEKFNNSFFSTVEKEGAVKSIRPLKNVDFMYDRITSGVYTLKVTGFWRKESLVNGRLQTTHSGLSIKVLNVLVNGYSNCEAEDEEYESLQLSQLREDSISLLTE